MYLPELGCLRELSRLAVMVRMLDGMRVSKNHKISAITALANNQRGYRNLSPLQTIHQSITVQNTPIRSSLADIENQKVQTLDALKKEHGKVQGWSKEQYRAETRKVLSTVRQELRAGTVGLNETMRPNATKW